MLALTAFQWTMLALMVACYLVICARMARHMAATGRGFWKWLLITICCTGVPGIIVLSRHGHLRRSAGADADEQPAAGRRCPHCGRLIVTPEPEELSGIETCPHCGLPIDEAKLG
jgi:hypothetical protein